MPLPRGRLHRRPDEVSGQPAWRIGEATGPLAALTGYRWNDYSTDFPFGTERWLEDRVLPDIRAALEVARQGPSAWTQST